jgi:hypothetical protein
MKPPTKSKEPMANKEIGQLELTDETNQTDNSYADDETGQTDNDSQVDEDSEDTEALAGATSDNERSEVEKIPKVIEKHKPNKKQPTQTVRDRIQASRKEPSVKGFQRKVSI